MKKEDLIKNKKMKNEDIENKEIIEKKEPKLESIWELWEWYYKFLVWINFWWRNFEKWKTYKLDENLIKRFKINKLL